MVSSSRPSPSQSRRGDDAVVFKRENEIEALLGSGRGGWAVGDRVVRANRGTANRARPQRRSIVRVLKTFRPMLGELYQTQGMRASASGVVVQVVPNRRTVASCSFVCGRRRMIWFGARNEAKKKKKRRTSPAPRAEIEICTNIDDYGCRASVACLGLIMFWISGSFSSAAKALSFFRSATSVA